MIQRYTFIQPKQIELFSTIPYMEVRFKSLRAHWDQTLSIQLPSWLFRQRRLSCEIRGKHVYLHSRRFAGSRRIVYDRMHDVITFERPI